MNKKVYSNVFVYSNQFKSKFKPAALKERFFVFSIGLKEFSAYIN